ncbi:MAG: polyphosphate:AMP phosphotransferase [Clostridiales bacterium]|nr:polyphosphate:AMP phosphotransferase [Clostridiales bacterium]
MLKNAYLNDKPDKETLKTRLKEQEDLLFVNQNRIKEKHLPVVVLVEGWGTAGKGTLIGKVINNIDPRFYKVATFDMPTDLEKRYPFLYRYFEALPEAGKFRFYNTGWMNEVVMSRLNGTMSDSDYEKCIASIRRFERQLTDNGYLVLKFFMHISKDEQKKRIENLDKDIDTKWRISEGDIWQNKHYKKCESIFEKYLEDTDNSSAPWYIVDAKSEKWTLLQVLERMNEGIDIALQNSSMAVPLLQNTFPLQKMPKLSEVSLEGKELTDEEYKEKLDELQDRLSDLHNRLYRKRVPLIIAYEGWDAAGKGGNIKRIAEALDPRGYEVHPIASPEPHEKSRHYLWRFWTRLPKDGHVAIFDRTWYGRVMVERIEGFCSENDWKRAYNEINEFEKELDDWGAVIIKFWVQIDKDTQLARFTDRQNTPEKQWKITDEDWRNREKWDVYEEAIDEMIAKTSTKFAPWYILESVDKKYARIKALQIIIDALEKKLK